MVGVAQLVEHLVVAQVAVGSSPITHPIYILYHGSSRKFHRYKQSLIPLLAGLSFFVNCEFRKTFAPVAQLDRAPDFESVGRRLESCRAHQ